MIIIRRGGLGYQSCKLLAEELNCIVQTVEYGGLGHFSPMYLRWGSTHSVANPYAQVFNCSKAIHRVSDKRAFRMLCNDSGISPVSYIDWREVEGTYKGFRTFEFDTPQIMRPSVHAGGNEVNLVRTSAEAEEVAQRLGPYYISDYIDKTHEYRVYIVQGKVVGVSEKIPHDKTALAWNFHGEDGNGKFLNFRWQDWPLGVIRVALKAHQLSSLHFGAVDVMTDDTGKAYVLELNSAPSLSPYRASCYGRAFRYMIRDDHSWNAYLLPMPQHTDLPQFRSYEDVIHPGLYKGD